MRLITQGQYQSNFFMSWFRKEKQPLEPPKAKRVQTEGLWIKCANCKQTLWKKDLQANFHCCPKCDYHFRISAREPLRLLFDDGQYTDHDADLRSCDPRVVIDARRYRDRVKKAVKETGLKDALIKGEGLPKARLA